MTCLLARPATAQVETGSQQALPEAAASEEPPPVEVEWETDGEGKEKKKKDVDLLFAPVPFSTPTTGAGIAGGVVAFYNPNGSPNQWMTGGGIVWTTRGSKGIAAFHKMSSGDDGFRLTASISYMDQFTKFYGIGADDGDRNDALMLEDQQFNIKATASRRIFPHGYLGARYQLGTHSAAPHVDEDSEDPPSLTPPPPVDQMESTLSVVGPVFQYDTTDSHTQPTKGMQFLAVWVFGFDALGSTFKHNKLTAEGSAYFRTDDDTVMAGSAMVCSANGDVPYYNLCLFGASADLRGYVTGRYRDRAAWSIQGEVRHQFTKRWGGVAFMGIGGISTSVGDLFSDSNFLPASGLGVRYLPFKNNDVHLRLDLAVGKNDHGVYLGIGEAF
ncbi:MAG: BamA/TamA family outer membrane protein [Porphyrobacter sp.]|nr:BamA/TamA family outer membrane protein [Porphyrobacter sp.]